MKECLPYVISAMILWSGIMPVGISADREFLTSLEIEKIQENQQINLRTKLYLEFAALRLKTAEDKLNGVELPEGDPFEFALPEELLDAYYRIIRSVMMNLDDAYQNADRRNAPRVQQALKALKGSAEKALVQLNILKRIAEEKKKEELWDLVNRAIDVTKGAQEGAESGITKDPDTPEKKSKRK